MAKKSMLEKNARRGRTEKRYAAKRAALKELIRNPSQRHALGAAAEARVRSDFDFHTSIRQLVSLFEAEWEKAS